MARKEHEKVAVQGEQQDTGVSLEGQTRIARADTFPYSQVTGLRQRGLIHEFP